MKATLSVAAVREAARLIDLPLPDDEVEPVRERLAVLLDAVAQIEHLVENTASPDARFDARWEIEQA